MKLFADMHVHSKFSIDGTSTMEEYCLPLLYANHLKKSMRKTSN